MVTFSPSPVQIRGTLRAMLAFAALMLLISAGCEPRATREELGTVVFKSDELPGAGQPYSRPEMITPPPLPPPPPSADMLPGAIDEVR